MGLLNLGANLFCYSQREKKKRLHVIKEGGVQNEATGTQGWAAVSSLTKPFHML